MYAEILFQQKVGQYKDTLTYEIPKDLNINIGQLVQISLRRKTTTGIVLEIHNNKPEFRTLKIIKTLSNAPLLSRNKIILLKWISNYYSSFRPVNLHLNFHLSPID